MDFRLAALYQQMIEGERGGERDREGERNIRSLKHSKIAGADSKGRRNEQLDKRYDLAWLHEFCGRTVC